jgi:hypothetical protein
MMGINEFSNKNIHLLICKTLNVQVDVNYELSDENKLKPNYLKLISKELNENNQKCLSNLQAESVLIERLSNGFEKKTIFHYLIQCYNRLNQMNHQDFGNDSKKVFNELNYLILSYCGVVLTQPDLFEQPEMICSKKSLLLVDYLLNSLIGYELPGDFLKQFVLRFECEPIVLKEIFEPVLTELSQRMKSLTLIDNYNQILIVMKRLLSIYY